MQKEFPMIDSINFWKSYREDSLRTRDSKKPYSNGVSGYASDSSKDDPRDKKAKSDYIDHDCSFYCRCDRL